MQRPLLLPTTSRYLLRETLSLLIPILLGFILIYVVVDVFVRLDTLLRHSATLWSSLRYFVFKVPLIVTQILPPAVIVSVILSLGMLARHNEIIAWRACGVSLMEMATPLLLAALLLSFAALAWNELVVPYSTRRYQQINLEEIRKRERRSLLSDHEIWYHGELGFYNIGYVDSARHTLVGVVIYPTDASFAVSRIWQIGKARWTGETWELDDVQEHLIDAADGTTPPPHPLTGLPERFDDFLEVQQDSDELSYLTLHERLQSLHNKGIDVTPYMVDLNLKLAIPFSCLALAAIGIPLAGRVRKHPSLAATTGAGAALGFGYWVILGLGNSLGQTGAIPPLAAAWSANLVFGLLAATLFLRPESGN